MKRRYFSKALVHLGVIFSFIFLSIFVILSAYGYKLNFDDYSFFQTSVIHLQDKVEDVNVYLDNELIGDSLPLKIYDVPLGLHDIVLRKDDYRFWGRKFELESGLVYKIYDLFFVPENIDEHKQMLAANVDLFSFSDDMRMADFDRSLNFLRIIDLKNLRQDNLIKEFEGEGLEFIKWIGRDHLFLNYEDDRRIINIDGLLEEEVEIPRAIKSISFDGNIRSGLGVIGKTLIYFYYDENGDISLDKITNDVYHFDASGGWIFVLKNNGDLIKVNRASNEKKIVKSGLELEKFELYYSGGYSFVRFEGGKFYFIDNSELSSDMSLIANNIVAFSSVSYDSRLLYTDAYELRVLDLQSMGDELITRFSESISHVDWYGSYQNFLFTKNGRLNICDIEGSNCHVLVQTRSDDSYQVDAFGRIFYLNELNLELLDLVIK